MKFVIVLIASICITAAIIYFLTYEPIMNMEKINLTASDNKKIAANLFSVDRPDGWLLLSHMMPATKESWDDFAEELQKAGYESLAIDLRGHGESGGGPDGFMKFTDTEHRAGINDLEAGWKFLQSRGAAPEKTVVIGASIGANLSLQFLTMHPEIGGGVLLSPGNYKGIDSALLVQKLNENQKILLAASKKDGNNAEQNMEYYNLASQVKNRHFISFDGAGHGTNLFELEEEYNLTAAIKKFLTTGRIN